MELTTIWFVLIAFLWIGYFVLEGFDFGVGGLLPVLAHGDTERRVMINTIGPVWDGNEVWVLVAIGGTFAAFPEWYATLLSAFYLPMLIILVALIGRGVAFEYRGKRDDPRWKARWDHVIVAGSLIPAFLWGVVLANLAAGLPLDADFEYTGGLADLFGPYALLGGAATLTLCLTHGAVFVALKTNGAIRYRANRLAWTLGLITMPLVVAFLISTVARDSGVATVVLAAAAIVALGGSLASNLLKREGWAFIGTAATIVLTVVTLFAGLYPQVLPSTIDSAYSLTVDNAAASAYTLRIMTWAAVAFAPLVLLYQGWTYWVFRRRLSVADIPAPDAPKVSSIR